MTHINKPLALRNGFGLSTTDSGRILLGIADSHRAYSTWAKMERDNTERESLSNSMRQYINLLLMLHNTNPILITKWLNKHEELKS